MARNFNGNEAVVLSKGALSLAGAYSALAMVKLNSGGDSSWQSLITFTNSGTFVSMFGRTPNPYGNGANKLSFSNTAYGFDVLSTVSVTSSDGWVVLGATKPSGSANVRMHFLKSGTWTHEVAQINNSGGGAATPPSLGTWTTPTLGYTSATDPLSAEVAWAALWDVELSDIYVERVATSWLHLLSSSPAAAWLLDQSATSMKVNDWTGGGASEASLTGTAVSTVSVPFITYGDSEIAIASELTRPYANVSVR